ncbi:MAG TPA: multicopper oxidase domain-containing protein [Longimicrobiales bacterium]|nr:multicopper oxidase domain-containing protein [Longimicrobiales bacterium]
MKVRPVAVAGCLSCILFAFTHTPAPPASRTFAPDSVLPNDNRTPGGSIVNGTTELHLVAQLAAWRPDLDVDSAATVQAFAETGGAPRIPGPLLRAEQGTDVRVTIANDIPDSTLIVHGMRAGTVADDTIVVRPGTRREVTFRAGAPGTYLYWGTTSGKVRIVDRTGRDGQLTGAIVIDPTGIAPDPAERIFVITVLDILPDTTKPPPLEDIFELAINGRSWPHSERIDQTVGDTVRWRWLNGSYLTHPMHLHGFHFRVQAKGDGAADTTYTDADAREVVTEFMRSGSTFAMEWTPTRAGNWLFHCHMAAHITPFPARPDSLQQHDAHDVVQHALQGMAGLVLGIRTTDRAEPHAVSLTEPVQHLRLLMQQAAPTEDPLLRATGYVLVAGDEPAPDSVSVPGPPLLLTRGETTAITVVNRTGQLTTVHWHGMELESIYDGVAGWSGAGSNLAPLIAPGDSFTVAFTPPRSGTYIYHTHMDEGLQLATGAYGPLIVLDPGQRFDPETDLIFMMARSVDGGTNQQAINGRHAPPPLTLRVGTTYRLRFVNIMPTAPIDLELHADSTLLSWMPISKDGAWVPTSQRVPGPSRQWGFGVGETRDFLWTPDRPMDAVISAGNEVDGFMIRQLLTVR